MQEKPVAFLGIPAVPFKINDTGTVALRDLTGAIRRGAVDDHEFGKAPQSAQASTEISFLVLDWDGDRDG